jgi:ribosomal-protein-alanine N-acetyltransferase
VGRLMLPLRTSRLELRDFVRDDFLALHVCVSDALVTRFFSWGPNTENETREFLRNVVGDVARHPREHYVFAIVLMGHGLVGGCFLDRRKDEEFEIGYYLRRDLWNQGLATEAVRALVPFSFHNLDAKRIYAHVDMENPYSARVLESAGFRLAGASRQISKIEGQASNSAVYAVLAAEWQTA